MLSAYPKVVSESATLDLVVSGRSLSRYGDGELKMCDGASIKSQAHDPALQVRLREVIQRPGNCLVGIPNIYSATPKAEHWNKHTKYSRLLAPGIDYVSAFVTRPDSAPWINTTDYWDRLESLWLGQDVTLVRGSSKSLTADDLIGAGTITEIIAPRQQAWAEYEELLRRVGTPARALICLGPTATVMAFDLCARGVHAVDLGHVGMFLRKRRRGEPMWVTDADKAVDRVPA